MALNGESQSTAPPIIPSPVRPSALEAMRVVQNVAMFNVLHHTRSRVRESNVCVGTAGERNGERTRKMVRQKQAYVEGQLAGRCQAMNRPD